MSFGARRPRENARTLARRAEMRLRPSLDRVAGLASVVLWIGSTPAAGLADPIYDRDTNVAVRDRDHPEYDPLGITLGAFRAFPKVATSVTYDDNIYAVNTKTGDFVFDFHPSLDIRSQWSRNDLRLSIDYDAARYAAHGAQDTASYSGNLAGRLDVDRDSSIAGDLSAARAIQPRISQNSIAGVLKPIAYDLVQGDLNGFRVFDRIKTSARIDVSRYSYDNTTDQTGAPVQEDYQDHDEVVGTARADYAVSPATAVFLESSINDHTYRLRPPLAPFRRDSHGYDVLTGVDFEATHLIGGAIGVGYQSQRYDDPQFDGVSGLALRGTLRWYVTPLITVTAEGNRTFQDSGLPNVAAARFIEESLAVDYELLRNFILGTRLDHQVYEYPGISGRDDRNGATLDGVYWLNRDVGVMIAYNYVRQRSTGANSGLSFADNRVTLTVTFRR
jgi:hypothetical protein